MNTPTFQKILDDQGFSKLECDLMYIFMGRILNGVEDDWHNTPYFCGKGHGKSLIANIIAEICGSCYKLDINRNGFGLKYYKDESMFVCFDDESLSGSDIYELSQNRIILVNYCKPARQIDWNVSGIIVGHGNPKLMSSDNIIKFEFDNIIQDMDPNLSEKLQKESAQLKDKCIKAYRDELIEEENYKYNRDNKVDEEEYEGSSYYKDDVQRLLYKKIY